MGCWESTAAWHALFDQVPEPDVVVTDGGLQLNITREVTTGHV